MSIKGKARGENLDLLRRSTYKPDPTLQWVCPDSRRRGSINPELVSWLIDVEIKLLLTSLRFVSWFVQPCRCLSDSEDLISQSVYLQLLSFPRKRAGTCGWLGGWSGGLMEVPVRTFEHEFTRFSGLLRTLPHSHPSLSQPYAPTCGFSCRPNPPWMCGSAAWRWASVILLHNKCFH